MEIDSPWEEKLEIISEANQCPKMNKPSCQSCKIKCYLLINGMCYLQMTRTRISNVLYTIVVVEVKTYQKAITIVLGWY